MIGMAFPSFFLGNLLIKWLAVDLGWFDPMSGLVSSNLPQDASGGCASEICCGIWCCR